MHIFSVIDTRPAFNQHDKAVVEASAYLCIQATLLQYFLTGNPQCWWYFYKSALFEKSP